MGDWMNSRMPKATVAGGVHEKEDRGERKIYCESFYNK